MNTMKHTIRLRLRQLTSTVVGHSVVVTDYHFMRTQLVMIRYHEKPSDAQHHWVGVMTVISMYVKKEPDWLSDIPSGKH